MAKRKVDVYPNRLIQRVTASAANAMTFAQIRFGVGLFGGVALILHRMEYFPATASIRELVAVTDELVFGLTNRDDLAGLTAQNLNVLDTNNIITMAVGAIVSMNLVHLPIIKDFSDMPGGGLIIPTNPLYLGVLTAGFSGPAIVDLMLYYTFKQMSDSDYIELVQGMLPANI